MHAPARRGTTQMLKTRAGEVVGIDIEPLTYTIDEVARALGVEPQQVVLGEGEAADGRLRL
jgi:hypothetical protein